MCGSSVRSSTCSNKKKNSTNRQPIPVTLIAPIDWRMPAHPLCLSKFLSPHAQLPLPPFSISSTRDGTKGRREDDRGKKGVCAFVCRCSNLNPSFLLFAVVCRNLTYRGREILWGVKGATVSVRECAAIRAYSLAYTQRHSMLITHLNLMPSAPISYNFRSLSPHRRIWNAPRSFDVTFSCIPQKCAQPSQPPTQNHSSLYSLSFSRRPSATIRLYSWTCLTFYVPLLCVTTPGW